VDFLFHIYALLAGVLEDICTRSNWLIPHIHSAHHSQHSRRIHSAGAPVQHPGIPAISGVCHAAKTRGQLRRTMGQSPNGNRLALIPLVFICSVVLMYWRLEGPTPVAATDEGYVQIAHSQKLSPLERYCHVEVPRRFYFAKTSSNWTLTYLAINIRHGDRSPIHWIDKTTDPPLPEQPPALIDGRALGYMPYLSSFSLHPLRHYSSAPPLVEGAAVSRILDPQGIMHSADRELGPGQLTSRGFMQHVSLGQQLRALYHPSGFLLALRVPEQIYIRSTNYARTIQSAAALLSAMVLDVPDPASPAPPTSPTSPTSAAALRGSAAAGTSASPPIAHTLIGIPIHFYPSEEDEVMHGIGARSSSHSVTDYSANAKETELSGGCKAAVQLTQKQKRSFEPQQALMSGLQRILGPGVSKMVSSGQ
jgi:hypothetical protein